MTSDRSRIALALIASVSVSVGALAAGEEPTSNIPADDTPENIERAASDSPFSAPPSSGPIAIRLDSLVPDARPIVESAIAALTRDDPVSARDTLLAFRASLNQTLAATDSDDTDRERRARTRATIHRLLGHAHRALGASTVARTHYEAAISAGSVTDDVLLGLVDVLETQDRLDTAITLVELAAEAIPSDRSRLTTRSARALAAIGRYAEADAKLRAHLIEYPADADVRRARAALLVERGRFSEARIELEILLRVTGADRPTLHAELATVVATFDHESDLRAAVAHYDAALASNTIERTSNDPRHRWAYSRALLLERLDRPEESRHAAEALLAVLAPQADSITGRVERLLGRLALSHGEVQRATEYFSRAHAHGESDLAPYLIERYQSTGDNESLLGLLTTDDDIALPRELHVRVLRSLLDLDRTTLARREVRRLVLAHGIEAVDEELWRRLAR